MNLLLLLMATGVASDNFGKGENNLEYRAFRGSWTNDFRFIELPLLSEVRSGVVMNVLGSGRIVAMETRLLGWRLLAGFVVVVGGPIAMETRLGLSREFVFEAVVSFEVFSLLSMAAAAEFFRVVNLW